MKRKTMTVRLHTARPNSPSEHEATYQGYKPITTLFYQRADGSWTRNRQIVFPECMGGSEIITHLSVSDDKTFLPFMLPHSVAMSMGCYLTLKNVGRGMP